MSDYQEKAEWITGRKSEGAVESDKTPTVVTVRIRGEVIDHGQAAILLQRASEYVKNPQVGHHGYIKRLDKWDASLIGGEADATPAWAEIEII